MPLTLTVTSYHRLSPGQEARKVVDQGSLSIGRAADNDWVLPDPERFLSGHHCTIQFRDGAYYVTDTSTNGLYLNRAEQRLGRGRSAQLNDGDHLTLGEYEIEVRITPPAAAGAPLPATPALDDPFAVAPAPLPDISVPALDSTPPLPETIPPDMDLFGPDWPPPMPPPTPPAAEPDHVAAEREFFRPPQAVPETIPADWDAAVARERPAAPSPVPVPSVASGGSARTALHAFLQGAGLGPLELSEDEAAALLGLLGRIFRQTVQGLMEVLRARSQIKGEFRLEQTTIRPTANNPLKFALSVEDAMQALLSKRGAAYLPPEQAVAEGFNDLKAHQLAVMAGMQAALAHLLKRFDPQALETRLGQRSLLDNLLPGNRKARYWELFTALYAELAREAEDDFHELFGREFARAYEEQVRKLR